jgi:hypothetical protein
MCEILTSAVGGAAIGALLFGLFAVFLLVELEDTVAGIVGIVKLQRLPRRAFPQSTLLHSRHAVDIC